MNNNLEHIDKLFNDGLANASVNAPEGVWDAVSSNLATSTASVVATKSFFAIAKWWILGTVVTASSVVTYFAYTKNEVKIQSLEAKKAAVNMTESSKDGVGGQGNFSNTEDSNVKSTNSLTDEVVVDDIKETVVNTQEKIQVSKSPLSSLVIENTPIKINAPVDVVAIPKIPSQGLIPVSKIYSQLSAKNAACKWEKVSVGFESKGNIKVFWNFGDDALITTSSNTTSHVYKNAGNYTITADVIDQETGVKLNTLYKEVKIGFNVNVNYRLVGENTFRFETDVNYENMQWLFPEKESQMLVGYSVEHSFKPEFVSGKVINICKNDLGCSDTFITWVKNSKTSKIEIFDAFTPNGDGTNDKYYVLAQGYENFSLTIIDMAGKLLFTTTNPETGWDGKFNGISCEKGIYWARVTYKFPGKNTETKTEQITLVKN